MIVKPQSWLRKLVNAQPAVYWPWRHSLRLTLITTVPLVLGFYYDNLVAALFVCLGGLLSAISVQTDPYNERFHRIFTAVPFGMAGFLVGSLIAGQGILTIAGVVLVALVAGWISFWGKAFSAGALQMLVMTVVASHLPPSSMSLTMPLLFGSGALYAAFLLGIEALFIPKQPELKLTSLMVSSLARLAQIAADTSDDGANLTIALHAALEAQANAYSVVVGAKTEDLETGRDILSTVDRLTVMIATQKVDRGDLRLVTETLDMLAKRILKPKLSHVTTDAPYRDGQLAEKLNQLVMLLQGPITFSSPHKPHHMRQLSKELGGLNEAGLRAQFDAQRSNFINIASLALCMLIAMLAEFHLPGNRSYWIPLSVAVILKPDFGSVFVRAVQRSAGTLVGVLLAILIFYFVPKGLWLVFVIGLLSSIIPWASLKNYAWQCTFLTPLILILIDLIIAGPTIDYGPQRLIDTLLGALIVLVFGYFIWPKPVKISFAARYSTVKKAIENYLNAIRSVEVPAHLFEETIAQRHHAYAEIFGLRKWTQSFLAEPPPASNEARSWLPRINDAERLVDSIGDCIAACETNQKLIAQSVLDDFQKQTAGVLHQTGKKGSS